MLAPASSSSSPHQGSPRDAETSAVRNPTGERDSPPVVDPSDERLTRSVSMYRRLSRFETSLLVLASFAAATRGAMLSAAFAILVRRTLNALSTNDFEETKRMALVFVALGAAVFFVACVQLSLFVYVAERNLERVRGSFVRLLLRRRISFFDAHNANELMAEIDEHSLALKDALGTRVAVIVQSVSCLVGGIIVAFYFSWKMTLILLCLSPASIFFGWFLSRTMRQVASSQSEAYSKAGEIANETLGSRNSVKTVINFSLQAKRSEAYATETVKIAHLTTKQGLYMGIGFGIFYFFYFFNSFNRGEGAHREAIAFRTRANILAPVRLGQRRLSSRQL